ncbi:T9SS type A sorting domain-containing protein [Cryomorphaceae bacterium 1068]|nr:T9SS type A sorting domain-containing protein [Cryomorphaceae bacterium 1068]
MRYLYLALLMLFAHALLAQNVTIIQIQTVPEGGGDASTLLGQTVTTSGIVTSTIGGDNLGAVYIQQAFAAAWGGLRLFSGEGLEALNIGDSIRVDGMVSEVDGETVLESVSNIEVLSEDASHFVNPQYPDPAIFESWNYEAEQYEGMVVVFQNLPDPLLVTEQNADGSSNFGEWRVGRSLDNPQEGCRVLSGRVTSSLLSSLNVSYVNDELWFNNSGQMQVDPIVVNAGDSFDFVQGILSESFSNHKLLPRNNMDFEEETVDSFEGDDVVLTALGVFSTETTEARLILGNDIVTAIHQLSFEPAVNDPGIVIYNLDGTRNTNFGDDGIFMIEGDESFAPKGIAMTSDGNYLMAAQTSFNDGTAGIVYEVLADGSGLNPSFGENGKVFIDAATDFMTIEKMLLNDDGEIFLAGGDFSDLFVVKLNPDGTLADEYGEGGVVTIDHFDNDNFMNATLHPNGDISLAFYVFTDFKLTRIDAQGQLITDFGTDGVSSIVFEGQMAPQFDMVPEEAELLIAGFQTVEGAAKHTIFRVDNDGEIIEDFGDDGFVLGSISPTEREAFFAVTRLADGNIAVGGVISDTVDVITWSRGIMVAVFDPNGLLLGSEIRYTNNNSEANAIFEDENGMLYVAGQLEGLDFPPSAGALVRFDPFEFLSSSSTEPILNFHVFPNPTMGAFNIELGEESISEIRVYDITGRLIDSKSMNSHSEIISYHLNAPAGMYILQISTESGKSATQKIQIENN